MIGVTNLSARVGAFALDNISFDVPRGAYGVVIGPTGSGKTTLLEVISGLIPQTGGSVNLSGRDVSSAPAESRGIGLVYQLGFLFPHLSVAENVNYGAANAATANDVARRLGVDALYARAVRSLSGGERQLVALARALARRPEILLLDEPFGALDSLTRSRLQAEFLRTRQRQSITMLMVTHDVEEAVFLSDRVVVIDSRPGRIRRSIDVALDTPRRRADPAFVALKEEILDLLISVEPSGAEA
jgi:sulfonate transport system ATP-binding protein